MDSNKTKTNIFTIEKLKTVIEKINKLCETDTHNDEEQEKTSNEIKKKIGYIKKYCNEFKSNLAILSESLLEILNLSSKFYKSYGDELTESVWNLYNDNNFHIELEDNLSSYEYFMHLFFMESKKFNLLKEKNLILLDVPSKNVKANYKGVDIQELYHLSHDGNKQGTVHYTNLLLDLIFFKVLSNNDVKTLYVSLSSFLVSIESSVMKFYKIVSLFSIILWSLPNKEDFANSLLLVLGGIMRDLGRSYLKTKGILNESLSYHKCKQNSNHQTHFFPAKILTSMECSFLELHFLNTLKNFLECIIPTREANPLTYWDDYLSLFYKQLDLEELDTEDLFPPHIEIFHYLTLFLCDFYFFFITNFSSISHDCMTSNFSNLDKFMQYSLSLISSTCRNPLLLYSYSEKKRKVLEIECEKTEYTMKDVFNHYGLSLIFYYFISTEFRNQRLLPLVLNKELYRNTYQTCLLSILSFEICSEINFMKEYKFFTLNFLEKLMMMDLIPSEILISTDQSQLIKCIIRELCKIENIHNNSTVQALVKSIKDVENFLVLLPRWDDLNVTQAKNIFHLNKLLNVQLKESQLTSILRDLSISCLILEEEIFSQFLDITETANIETLSKLIKDLIAELKDNKDNQKLNKFKDEVLSKLRKLLK